MSRNRIRGLAKLVLGAFLFAQAAVALAACDWGQRAPAQVIAAMGDIPCCPDDEAPSASSGNANLCLAHCTSDAQSVDTTGLAVPIFTASAALTISPAPAAGTFALSRPTPAGYTFAAPPLIILFQNFRI